AACCVLLSAHHHTALCLSFFFFTAPAPTEISTLSLHDALPISLDEALMLLREHGDDAKVMAGGQSLIPLLKLRFASPALVVDIGRVPGLSGIESDDATLRIGTRTRHVDLERDTSLDRVCPILREAARQISDPLVRNLGTVGGSLCHADPAGDWGSVMLALDAEFVARSFSGADDRRR